MLDITYYAYCMHITITNQLVATKPIGEFREDLGPPKLDWHVFVLAAKSTEFIRDFSSVEPLLTFYTLEPVSKLRCCGTASSLHPFLCAHGAQTSQWSCLLDKVESNGLLLVHWCSLYMPLVRNGCKNTTKHPQKLRSDWFQGISNCYDMIGANTCRSCRYFHTMNQHSIYMWPWHSCLGTPLGFATS